MPIFNTVELFMKYEKLLRNCGSFFESDDRMCINSQHVYDIYLRRTTTKISPCIKFFHLTMHTHTHTGEKNTSIYDKTVHFTNKLKQYFDSFANHSFISDISDKCSSYLSLSFFFRRSSFCSRNPTCLIYALKFKLHTKCINMELVAAYRVSHFLNQSKWFVHIFLVVVVHIMLAQWRKLKYLIKKQNRERESG